MGESRRIITAAYPAMEKEIRAKVAKELMELGPDPDTARAWRSGYVVAILRAVRTARGNYRG